ncbi:unnamed protein product [Cuscuta campestris]|uniref:RNase H type-1 domain-containing protein n=1 Tax=Cuscuta campestris TaxID=132261 RepID=A0A484N6U8_9ASTE|nr:unnamed protein product [Cuscuta campestris]
MQQINLYSYNYSTSRTSEVVPCGSPYCFPPKTEDCPLRAPNTYPCPYEVVYMAKNTSTRGILVKDVMHLETYDDNQTRSSAPVIFGCGQVETGDLLGEGLVNGLLGLGYGALDVTSLLSSQGLVRNSFSMCFAPNGYGRFAFGDLGDLDQMSTPFLPTFDQRIFWVQIHLFALAYNARRMINVLTTHARRVTTGSAHIWTIIRLVIAAVGQLSRQRQAVADFLVEMTGHQEEEPARAITELWWSMSVDGASGPKGYGGGVVFTTPEGFKVYHALIFNFKLTNNEAEYEALIGGLRLAKTLQITCLGIKSGSSLVVGHINGNMEAKGEKMQKYRDLARELLKDLTDPGACVQAETLEKASIEGFSVSVIEEDGHANPDRVEPDDIWMDDLVRYYMTGQFPEDEDMVRKVKLRAPRFQMLEGRLYKRAFGGPLLRCLTRAEAERVIVEVHEGVCAAHQMSRTLTQRIILLGYFWPTMNQDCKRNELVRGVATYHLGGRPVEVEDFNIIVVIFDDGGHPVEVHVCQKEQSNK